jgi:hypothetical protein
LTYLRGLPHDVTIAASAVSLHPVNHLTHVPSGRRSVLEVSLREKLLHLVFRSPLNLQVIPRIRDASEKVGDLHRWVAVAEPVLAEHFAVGCILYRIYSKHEVASTR